MRDFPFFTTKNGIASLTLREIPYTKRAYIKIQSASDPAELLAECKSFCCAVGAEWIYISGDPICEGYPFHTVIWEMQCPKSVFEDTDASLFPVTEATADRWREIYNLKVIKIPNAAWMTTSDLRAMLDSRDGYFVHRKGTLLGIGRIEGNTILWIASEKQGEGKNVLSALTHAITADMVRLEVASENKKAVAFYENLGFIKTRELAKWYLLSE